MSGEYDPFSGQHADFAILLPSKMAARFKRLFTSFDATELERTRLAKALEFQCRSQFCLQRRSHDAPFCGKEPQVQI